MKHFGDITKIDGHKVPIVDVICGGSPCQDLSIAGLRKGLEGERSGLFLEMIRVIKEMHDECRRTNQPIRPRWMVFENVCGIFSSGNPKGEDFRIVLEETARIADGGVTIPRPPDGLGWSNVGVILADGWSLAWKVHSAEHWGVPQRRARVSLVADFGGQRAPDILFEKVRVESEGLSGNPEQSGEAREGTPFDPERSIGAISFQERAGCEGGGKGILIQDERTAPLKTLNNQAVCIGGGQANEAMNPDVELSKTLNCTHEPMKVVVKTEAKVFGISPFESNAMKSSNPDSGIYEADTARTLDLNGGTPTCNQGGMVVVEPKPGNCFSQDAYDKYTPTETSASLKSSGGNYGGGTETIVTR